MELKKQKILMFTRTMALGGTENVVLQMCRILQPKVDKIIVCSCGGVNEQKLQEMGIAHYTIADMENKSPKTILKIFRDVWGIIRKEGITVVHTHHRMAAFYARILKFLCPITTVNTSHGSLTDKRFLTRFSLSGSNLIACGKGVKQNLIDAYGINGARVTVIRNAVEEFNGKLIPDERLQKLHQEGYILVGCVGRLSEEKGVEYFIRSYPAVMQAGHKVRYVIVGDGPDMEKLQDLTRQLDIYDDVLFMGYRSDVQNVMAQLDFFVISSLTEGLPLTPLEVFSLGKTIIGTNISGTSEIIDHQKNGLLVPTRDADAIAEAVLHLVEQPALREQFENNAIKTFKEEFSFEVFTRRVEKFYTEL